MFGDPSGSHVWWSFRESCLVILQRVMFGDLSESHVWWSFRESCLVIIQRVMFGDPSESHVWWSFRESCLVILQRVLFCEPLNAFLCLQNHGANFNQTCCVILTEFSSCLCQPSQVSTRQSCVNKAVDVGWKKDGVTGILELMVKP